MVWLGENSFTIRIGLHAVHESGRIIHTELPEHTSLFARQRPEKYYSGLTSQYNLCRSTTLHLIHVGRSIGVSETPKFTQHDTACTVLQITRTCIVKQNRHKTLYTKATLKVNFVPSGLQQWMSRLLSNRTNKRKLNTGNFTFATSWPRYCVQPSPVCFFVC